MRDFPVTKHFSTLPILKPSRGRQVRPPRLWHVPGAELAGRQMASSQRPSGTSGVRQPLQEAQRLRGLRPFTAGRR